MLDFAERLFIALVAELRVGWIKVPDTSHDGVALGRQDSKLRSKVWIVADRVHGGFQLEQPLAKLRLLITTWNGA